jgi:hypothetical protein
MAILRFFVFLFMFPYSVWGQGINKQLTDQSELVMNDGAGRTLRFKKSEAYALFSELWKGTNPALAENKHFPPALKERLTWAHKNAYTMQLGSFPPAWENGMEPASGISTFAKGTYCDVPSLKIFRKPCIIAYPFILMLILRGELRMSKPDHVFKNDFAVCMGHEITHLERDVSFFRPVIPHEEIVQEETRAWLKTVRDFVHPLLQMKQPLSRDFGYLDGLLIPCGYKLPCQAFEDEIRNRRAGK